MLDKDDTGRRRLLKLAATAIVAGLLHGCGGGGDGGRVTSGGGFTTGAAPTISAQPSSQTVIAGATATFSVTATGSPAPTYQWQLSDDNGTTFDAITGATGSTFTTQPAAAGNSGQQYRVVVSNSAGSVTSNAAMLTVTPVPG